MKWFLSVFLITSSIFAFNVDVSWRAFKTPLKIGVGGKFDSVNVSGDKLENLKVSINTLSVNSNHKDRDNTLVESFFKVQKITKIEASVKSIKDNILTVEIDMNGIKRDTPMKFLRDGNSLKASGYIDLSDFNMLPSLKSINSSCFDLHAGKTWQDIEIEVQIDGLK